MSSKIVPLALLFLLNLADVVMTYFGLKAGATEMNPMMAWVWTQGTIWFFAVKLVGTLACIAALLFLWSKHDLTRIAAWFLVGLYTSVVIWNSYQLWMYH